MRIAFALSNLTLPKDLSEGYANIEIDAVYSSYTDTVAGLGKVADEQLDRVDVVLLADDLTAPIDRSAGLTLVAAIEAIREARPKIRVVVVSKRAADDDQLAKLGVERFVEHDPRASAINLATLLKIPAKSEIAKIIAVAGHQGGAGRTTLAQAIADGLSDYVNRNTSRGGVLLWELDLEHPTLAFEQEIDLLAGDHGRRTIARLLNQAPIRGDEDFPLIRESIVPREKSKLSYDVLLAPFGIREVMAMYQAYPNLVDLRERLAMIMTVLSRHYQAIVLDLPTSMIGDPATIVALQNASHIVTVATPSPAGLRSINTMRVIAGDMHIEGKTKLVLNRVKRDDAAYIKYCQAQAQGSIELMAQIPDGAPASAFTAIGPRLLGLER